MFVWWNWFSIILFTSLILLKIVSLSLSFRKLISCISTIFLSLPLILLCNSLSFYLFKYIFYIHTYDIITLGVFVCSVHIVFESFFFKPELFIFFRILSVDRICFKLQYWVIQTQKSKFHSQIRLCDLMIDRLKKVRILSMKFNVLMNMVTFENEINVWGIFYDQYDHMGFFEIILVAFSGYFFLSILSSVPH